MGAFGLQICSAGGYFFLFFLDSVGNVSPVFCLRFRFLAFLGRFGFGFRWCLGLFGSTADELHFCLCLGSVALWLFVRLLRPFLVCSGFRRQRFEIFLLAVSVAFLGRFGLGFRWCLGLFGSTADELHFCLCLG